MGASITVSWSSRFFELTIIPQATIWAFYFPPSYGETGFSLQGGADTARDPVSSHTWQKQRGALSWWLPTQHGSLDACMSFWADGLPKSSGPAYPPTRLLWQCR